MFPLSFAEVALMFPLEDSQTISATPAESGLRYVVESLIALALAVLLVRAFAVEGYIISTGSMAPFLLGYHKQVVCPDCRFPFAVGVPIDEEQPTIGPVACPNCGQTQIRLNDVPRNEGDQLLVQKMSYLFRRPKRWEVVVFQNPGHPTQAYVKRVIGLPSERVQVIAGDVWINGELVRKTLAEQRSVRIPICSHQHRPDEESSPRWEAEEGWQTQPNGFELAASVAQVTRRADEKIGERGGATDEEGEEAANHKQDSDTNEPSKQFAWVTYRGDATKRDGQQIPRSPSTTFWPADDYGYNGLTEPTTRYLVRDLMLSLKLEFHSGRGDFSLTLSDGRQHFDVQLAAGERELRLFVDENDQPSQTAKLAGPLWRQPILVEMSLFDRQLLLAINGETIFVQKLAERTNDDRSSSSAANSQSPVSFGACDLHVSVSDLTLFRDVYYTQGDGRHGVKEAYPIGPDEYFFLGDNSPVSLDSRSWTEGVVREQMLIGKPFLVHLPSRPGRIKVGSAEWHIRVPDWGRIRYIR